MSKSSKSQKNKVPKITEAEYAAYVTALKESSEEVSPSGQGGNLAEQGEKVNNKKAETC